nr:ABC transporter permease [bacterium]
MKKIYAVIIKEFKQIFRDKGMLPLIFVMPLIQLIILTNAATFEVKNISFYAVDYDNSPISREIISKYNGSPYFDFYGSSTNINYAENLMRLNKIKFILVIPDRFEKNLTIENKERIQFIINAIDGSTAGVINAYAFSILTDFKTNMDNNFNVKSNLYGINGQSAVNHYNWYNETQDYKFYMTPGILVILVTIIGMFLSAMSLAKEKEIGTIEQLNVSPVLKYELIIGKLIPVLIISLFELTFGIIVAKLFFGTPFRGGVINLYSLTVIYLIGVLSFGILISTIAETQQQAMFLSWFFMVVFILLSGIFTAVENMPLWAQTLTKFIPLSYYISSVRNILLKGA